MAKSNKEKVKVIAAATFLTLGSVFNYESISSVFIKDWGILNSNLSRVFHTDGVITKLNYKPHRQEHSLSCEIAALKVALSAHGLDIPESGLLKYLLFDTTPREDNVWGDPNKGFVGDIDGRMGKTGYGVYWGPIAELGSLWKSSKVAEDMTASQLAGYISDGKPVITWGYYGRGKNLLWYTKDGKRIDAIDGEHARVVVGFEGNSSGPEGFYVFDPIYGEMYWSRDKFMRNWDSFGRMGVVVGD